MEAELLNISKDFTTWLTPMIVVGLTFITLMFIKETLIEVVKGLRFRLNPTFKESDIVFLDSERAIIVKLGLLTTVFGVTKPDGTYCWRYVPNSLIHKLKLEKIINLDNMKLPKRTSE